MLVDGSNPTQNAMISCELDGETDNPREPNKTLICSIDVALCAGLVLTCSDAQNMQ